MTHEYYDWADTDDLLRHMRDQHGLPLLTLVHLGAAHRDDSAHRAFHKEAHGPACSRCSARPAPNQAQSVCDDCYPGTPLCQGCYVSHAREALAEAGDDPATTSRHSDLRREKISRAAEIVRAADEQEVRDARVFLGSLRQLTEKFLEEGETAAAAYAEQLAALVTEWAGSPGDPVLRARVEQDIREFNELAGG